VLLGKALSCLYIYGRRGSQASKARATRVGKHNELLRHPPSIPQAPSPDTDSEPEGLLVLRAQSPGPPGPLVPGPPRSGFESGQAETAARRCNGHDQEACYFQVQVGVTEPQTPRHATVTPTVGRHPGVTVVMR
jgi:hypothetical protein